MITPKRKRSTGFLTPPMNDAELKYYSKAYDCFQRAVEQGSPNAMFCLGEYFYEG